MLGFSKSRIHICRADSRLAPSQWETSLQSNVISHWLGANLESVLYTAFIVVRPQRCRRCGRQRCCPSLWSASGPDGETSGGAYDWSALGTNSGGVTFHGASDWSYRTPIGKRRPLLGPIHSLSVMHGDRDYRMINVYHLSDDNGTGDHLSLLLSPLSQTHSQQ